MNLYNRFKAPTPKLFQNLRNIGLTMATIGGIILSAPVTLPTIIVTIGGYITIAGGVISAISQLTVDDYTTNDEQ